MNTAPTIPASRSPQETGIQGFAVAQATRSSALPSTSCDSFHFPRRRRRRRAPGPLARSVRRAERPRGDLTRDLRGAVGRQGGGEGMGRGGEGRAPRRHRRQLCERVQCVRERESGKSVRRRVAGSAGSGGGGGGGGVPGKGQVRAPKAAPLSATPSASRL